MRRGIVTRVNLHRGAERLRGAAGELVVLCAEGAPLARGVESDRSAARLIEECSANIASGRIGGRRKGTVAGAGN
eukprot:4780951-Pleurochrysis_carterae.AAC.1